MSNPTAEKRSRRKQKAPAGSVRIIDYSRPIPPNPRCEAEVSSEQEISWRTGNERAISKAQRLGVDLYQCFMTGTYLVGNRWYCKRHAALIALDLLAEKP